MSRCLEISSFINSKNLKSPLATLRAYRAKRTLNGFGSHTIRRNSINWAILIMPHKYFNERSITIIIKKLRPTAPPSATWVDYEIYPKTAASI